MKVGPSSRGRESMSLLGGWALSLEQAHTGATNADRPTKHLSPPSVESRSVPSRPILKRSKSGLSGKP